jgi:predicted TIM-barrel fold metal-dependent hydrolase
VIIDSHVHMFSEKIIANVSQKTKMTARLCLQTDGADARCGTAALAAETRAAGISACLLLPTSDAANVMKVNTAFLRMVRENDFLHTAGTLHPARKDNDQELRRLQAAAVRALKFCSFSQGFALEAPETLCLFDLIRDFNGKGRGGFFVILDTLYRADRHFGTDPRHNTTPALLGNLVRAYPDVTFVAAHMGGLDAPFADIVRHLPPAANLYLDTSNAGHTLPEKEFVNLAESHGPAHILFGSDWPWFSHDREIKHINKLLGKAGYTEKEKAQVFGGNIARLLGIEAGLARD